MIVAVKQPPSSRQDGQVWPATLPLPGDLPGGCMAAGFLCLAWSLVFFLRSIRKGKFQPTHCAVWFLLLLSQKEVRI